MSPGSAPGSRIPARPPRGRQRRDPADPPRDDFGRPVPLSEPPRRMVSLVPSLTELVCVLGAADRLIAVTRYCSEPAEVVGALPKLGGTKNPDVDAIVALAPDLVLVNGEENRQEDFQALIAAGLSVFVSFPRTVAESEQSIERLGAVIETRQAAAAMAAAMAAARSAAPPALTRVFCPIWRKPWMSFNRDTYAHDLLRCCGGDNVCAGGTERYPLIDLHAVAQADPEVVLLPDEPYPFGERHRAGLAALAQTSAWRTGRVHFVDGKALSWYGPRTAPALRFFRTLL
jgi:ABC-type Fe3+-hydroxamate transport system substrate-binding protein